MNWGTVFDIVINHVKYYFDLEEYENKKFDR